MLFRREEAEKIGTMNCTLLKYLQDQHNQHPHQTLFSVTFRSVTLPHQGVHIFQIKQHEQVLTIITRISLIFNLT